MDTIDLWKGDFGNDYTARNATANLQPRIDLWKSILPRGVTSVLEVGANVGANLEAIAQISDAELCACEPNAKARGQLAQKPIMRGNLSNDTADSLSFGDESVDLVFTCGVLIHVPPDLLEKSMREIHRVSKRWIICGEYFAPSEEMVPYRGQHAAMWRRDYGSLYMDMFPDLICIKNMFAWKRLTGLDNLTVWVFEKRVT